MNIAIIPARGGSKRIPKKNIKLFNGKPLIAYSIEVAKQSGLFDRIIVSTDDEEIASVAKHLGAEVPFIRPQELSDDFTGTNQVVAHTITWLNENNINPNFVCCIYATAVFLESSYLIDGFNRLTKSNKTYAFSVTSFPYPIFRALKINSNETTEMFWPEHLATRSQDLPEAFHDVGQFYWGKPEGFLKDISIFSSDSIAIKIPRHLTQDIDTLEDWKLAERNFLANQSLER